VIGIDACAQIALNGLPSRLRDRMIGYALEKVTA